MYFAPLLLALPQINNGKLVPLVISGSKRSALLPDVTTIAEAGNPDHTTPAVTVPVHSGATSSQGSVYRPHKSFSAEALTGLQAASQPAKGAETVHTRARACSAPFLRLWAAGRRA